MIAVAVVAAFAGTTAWGARRSARFGILAARHQQLRQASLEFEPLACIPTETPRTQFHATLAAKYQRAARYPWLPVPPDPSEPLWPE